LFAPSFPATAPLPWKPSADGPWHVGIVVTPAHEGVFLRCMSGIFNRLDARRFRVTVMGARPAEPVLRSAMRQSAARYLRLPLRFDHAAQQIRAARFDLVYFWEVGTDSSNHFLPFLRLAPVQCTGWGWPDTSAAPELDHHLTARGACGDDAQRFFSERLVALPHLPPYFFRPPIPERPHPRSHFGLRDDAHLYVCVQNLRKVHPDFDPILRGILEGDRRGIAVFVGDAHPAVGELLRQRWSETCAGIAERIVLLPRLQPQEYFHLLAISDVALDTLHFGGSNTAYDALAAGVPVVTLPTEQPRGRYMSAMYRAMGLDDCVVASAPEYVERALRLGTDAGYRQAVSSTIRREGACLFENPQAVRQLEDFFAQVCHAAAG
jgi:predicted O-linked N-acetylglucosamine transferase (SPINDLY family)